MITRTSLKLPLPEGYDEMDFDEKRNLKFEDRASRASCRELPIPLRGTKQPKMQPDVKEAVEEQV